MKGLLLVHNLPYFVFFFAKPSKQSRDSPWALKDQVVTWAAELQAHIIWPSNLIMYMFHVFWTVIIAISYDTMLPCGRSIHWLLSLTSWRVHIHFCYFCWIHIHLFPRRVTWFVALLDFGLSWFVNFTAEPINLTGFPHFPRNSWNHSGWINIYCFLVFSQWIILVEYMYILQLAWVLLLPLIYESTWPLGVLSLAFWLF